MRTVPSAALHFQASSGSSTLCQVAAGLGEEGSAAVARVAAPEGRRGPPLLEGRLEGTQEGEGGHLGRTREGEEEHLGRTQPGEEEEEEDEHRTGWKAQGRTSRWQRRR